jgi:hypothetical protein
VYGRILFKNLNGDACFFSAAEYSYNCGRDANRDVPDQGDQDSSKGMSSPGKEVVKGSAP